MFEALPDLEGRVLGLAFQEGEGWIGTRPEGPPSKQLLYRLINGTWIAVTDFPIAARRADIIDLDPDGMPWVCTFTPEGPVVEDPTLSHFDGKHWKSIPMTDGFWPTGLDMVSGNEGWVSGHYGELLHYKDGTWRKIVVEPEESERYKLYLSDVEMVDQDEGWAVGWSGLTLYYRDGLWRKIDVPAAFEQSQIWGLSITDGGQLWIVGSEGLIASYHEEAWRIFEAPSTQTLHEIDMLSSSFGWAVGDAEILRFDGNRWNKVPLPVSTPNLLFQSVAFDRSGDGWIVGNGLVLKSARTKPAPLRPIVGSNSYAMLRHGAHMVASADMDADGDLDLLTISAGFARLSRNEGSAGFVETPLFSDQVSNIQNLLCGDLDDDYVPDLYVYDYLTDSHQLYLNPGDGTFKDPFKKAGLQNLRGSMASAFVDGDLDGHLDLSMASSAMSNTGHDRFFPNNGAGGFGAVDFKKQNDNRSAVLWGDLNGDYKPDMLVSNGAETQIHLSQGNGDFQVEVKEDMSFSGSQTLLLDLDVDGDLDLITLQTDLDVWSNDGSARFKRVSPFGAVTNEPTSREEISGICNAGDIDHDGFPDFLVQTVTRGKPVLKLYLHQPDGTYKDLAPFTGLPQEIGLSASFSDWDDDGDLDLFIGGKQKSFLLENVQNDMNYLKIRLEGVRGNRMAFGSEVRVYEAGRLGDPDYLRGFQQLGMGQPLGGVQNISELHFGLSGAISYDVLVRFSPDRQITKLNVGTGQTLLIQEYQGSMRLIILAYRGGMRALLRANYVLESIKLLTIIVLFFLLRFTISASFGSFHRILRWVVMISFFLGYLVLAARWSGQTGSIHAYHFGGFSTFLLGLFYADHLFCQWRKNNYLGHYRLLECLGRGGMGVVYRARNVVSRQVVALKTLHPEILESEQNRIRFFREAAILNQLDHPNIVKVYESGEAGNRGYISMELLRGSNLKQIIRKSGPLELDTAIQVTIAVADALIYMHQCDILHRDLKTENIFIVDRKPSFSAKGSKNPIVKLLDFGLSRDHQMKTLTRIRELIGTLAYMAPEQFRGEQVDHRADIYALGVVLYEILTGEFPFDAENDLRLMEMIRKGEAIPIEHFLPDLPTSMVAVVNKAITPDPMTRFSSAEEMRDGLAMVDRDPYPKVISKQEIKIVEPPHEPKESVVALKPVNVSSCDEAWRQDFNLARQMYDQGKVTKAQTLILSCLDHLQEVVAGMNEQEWDDYYQRFHIDEVHIWLNRITDDASV